MRRELALPLKVRVAYSAGRNPPPSSSGAAAITDILGRAVGSSDKVLKIDFDPFEAARENVRA